MTNPIEKYIYPPFVEIFSKKNVYIQWLDVVLSQMFFHKEFPRNKRNVVTAAYYPGDLINDQMMDLISHIETKNGHEFNAFLRALSMHSSPDKEAQELFNKFLHLGLTSSDVQDTALAKIFEACGLKLNVLGASARVALTERLDDKRTTPGYTHGQPAVYTTWANRAQMWSEQISWHSHRLDIRLAKATGPVGVNTNRGGYTTVDTPMQIIPRKHFMPVYNTIEQNVIGMDKICTDIRYLCGQGVLLEGKADERDGSSAMPKKRNPIQAEQICGLSRMVLSRVRDLKDCQVTWLERDLVHSSIERVTIPEVMHLYATALVKFRDLISELVPVEPPLFVSLGAAIQQEAYDRVNQQQWQTGNRFAAYDEAKNA